MFSMDRPGLPTSIFSGRTAQTIRLSLIAKHTYKRFQRPFQEPAINPQHPENNPLIPHQSQHPTKDLVDLPDPQNRLILLEVTQEAAAHQPAQESNEIGPAG